MKLVKTCLLIFVILLLIIWRVFEINNTGTTGELFNSVINYGKNNELLEQNSFDIKIFINALNDLKTYFGIKKPLNINNTYKKDHFNICIGNFSAKKSIKATNTKSGLDSFISKLKMNLVSFPPDVLFADSYLLYIIANEQLSEYVPYYLLRTGYFFKEFGSNNFEERLDVARNIGACQQWERLSRIQRIKNGNKNIFNDYPLTLLYGIKCVNFSQLDNDELRFGFYPFLTHELTHLKNADWDPYFGTPLLKRIQLKMKGVNYREEDYADNLGWGLMINLPSVTSEKNENLSLRANQFLAPFKFIRDIYLVEAFDGFRGMDAKDVLVTLIPKDSVSKEVSDYPVNWYQKIASAKHFDIPAMTVQEFNNISKTISGITIGSTHRHFFVRMLSLCLALDHKISSRTGYVNWGNQSAIIDFIAFTNYASKEAIAELFVKDPKSGMGISLQNISLQSFNLEKAINYKNNRTLIALHKTGNGWVELVGDEDDLEEITIVYSTRNKKLELDSLAILRNFDFKKILYDCFIHSGVPERMAQIKLLKLYEHLRGTGSRGYVEMSIGNINVVAYRINESPYLKFILTYEPLNSLVPIIEPYDLTEEACAEAKLIVSELYLLTIQEKERRELTGTNNIDSLVTDQFMHKLTRFDEVLELCDNNDPLEYLSETLPMLAEFYIKIIRTPN